MGRTTRIFVSLWIGCLLAVVSPGRASAQRLVVSDFTAESDVRDHAGALGLLIKGQLYVGSRKPVLRRELLPALTRIVTALPQGGLIVDPQNGPRLLKALGADRLITGTVARDGHRLDVTLRVYDGNGNILGMVEKKGDFGALVRLSGELAAEVAPMAGTTATAPANVSFGQLVPFVRANLALANNNTDDAVAALLIAQPVVAGRVPPAKEIVDAVIAQLASSPQTSGLDIGLLGGDARVTLEIAARLIEAKKDLDAAYAGLARAHLAQLKLDLAEQDLEAVKKSTDPRVRLARVALYHARGDQTARDKELLPLLSGALHPPVLAWIAEQEPGILGPLEEAIVNIGQTLLDQPHFATRFGLRAAAAGVQVERALRLISTEYLSRDDLDVLQSLPLTPRLRAELLLREGKAEDALEILAAAPEPDASTRTLLGRVQRGLRHPADAKTALEPIRDLSPDLKRLYARVLQDLGDDAGAQTLFGTLEDKTSAETQLARAAEEIKNNQPAAAVAILERALAENPENIDILGMIAPLYRKLGMTSRADSATAFKKKLEGGGNAPVQAAPLHRIIRRNGSPVEGIGALPFVLLGALLAVVAGGIFLYVRKSRGGPDTETPASIATAPAPAPPARRSQSARAGTQPNMMMRPDAGSIPSLPIPEVAPHANLSLSPGLRLPGESRPPSLDRPPSLVVDALSNVRRTAELPSVHPAGLRNSAPLPAVSIQNLKARTLVDEPFSPAAERTLEAATDHGSMMLGGATVVSPAPAEPIRRVPRPGSVRQAPAVAYNPFADFNPLAGGGNHEDDSSEDISLDTPPPDGPPLEEVSLDPLGYNTDVNEAPRPGRRE